MNIVHSLLNVNTIISILFITSEQISVSAALRQATVNSI